ncbi:MAG: OmpA family protein, partial [Leptospiraceae bacterium]|nr:OmpA family protein [Leptospiraceae bacterium]
GGWDFYSTRKTDQGWSEPVLVPELSSPDNEMHLSIHGGDLYFASDRSGGKGHYDLYSTSSAISLSEETFASRDAESERSRDPLEEERASTIREGDAESYTNPTANRGREEDLEGILQNYDAAMDGSFRSETPEEYRSRIDRGLELAFEGAEDPGMRDRRRESLIVQDKETGRPLSVEVKMRPYYQEEGKKRPEAMVGRSDDAGLLQLPNFDSEGLEVTISLPGYAPYHRIIDYRAVFSGKRIVYMERARKGDSFDATAIRFDANSAVLRDESEPYLESLVEFLKQNPTFRLKIIGHTDLHGTKEYNDTLSYRRALSVRNYLVYHGVEKERLEIEGAGFSKPVVNKKGEPFDAQNRRTEFLILQD